jgi:hypothetical protein
MTAADSLFFRALTDARGENTEYDDGKVDALAQGRVARSKADPPTHSGTSC